MSLLGEVLDFCETRSNNAALELFVFCDNMSWDVVAELLLWGVKLSINSPNRSWMDGGTLFSFSMF